MKDPEGWIKLHRILLDSQVFNNEGLLKLWIYCLLRANHKEKWVSVVTGRGRSEIKVQPGQFIFGRKQAAKDLKCNPSSVRNRMAKLKKIKNVDIQPDTHFSIVTICNWEIYQHNNEDEGQANGQAKDNQRTGKGQPKDTDKNEENVKNEENKPSVPLKLKKKMKKKPILPLEWRRFIRNFMRYAIGEYTNWRGTRRSQIKGCAKLIRLKYGLETARSAMHHVRKDPWLLKNVQSIAKLPEIRNNGVQRWIDSITDEMKQKSYNSSAPGSGNTDQDQDILDRM